MTQFDQVVIFGIIGQVMPQLIDFVNKHIPQKRLRFVISIVICLLLSLLANFNQLQFGSWQNFLLDGLICWTSSQQAFHFYYDGTQQQAAIRYTSNPLPLKALIPNASLLKTRIAFLFNK